MTDQHDHEPQKTTSAPARGKVTVTAGTVVFLVLALVGFYYLRTTSTAERLTERNLRDLDRIGRTIELRIENFDNILRGLAGDPAGLERRVGLIPNGVLECANLGELGPDGAEFRRTAVRLVNQSLHFDYLTTDTASDDTGCPQADLGEGRRRVLEISWPLGELETITRSEFFDQLLLVNGSGTVFLRPSGGGLRLDELPAPDSASEPGEDSPSAPERRITAVQEVPVAGGQHLLFLQPLRIELESRSQDAGHTEWVLGGLVSKPRFRAETIAFEPPDLLFLSLLLIFGLLAMPFLRLGLIGHRERLELRDILSLGLSFLLASGVVGISLAVLARHQSVRRTLDGQLQAVAEKLEENLGRELDGARAELDRQSTCFRGFMTELGLEDVEQRLDRLHDGEPWMRTSIFGAGQACAGGAEGYRAFAMIFWADPDGNQVAKWTPNLTNTPRVPVATRAYYRRIRDRRGWRVPASDDAASETDAESPDEFFLESIESLTTGRHQAAVSSPFCWDDNISPADCAEDHLGVAAMIIPPVSLDRPVLPLGFEFAVIEPGGRTLFHSKQERNLRENFFDETDGDPWIQSVVAAQGMPAPMRASYLGRTRRLSVRPVDDTPLMLAVAMDAELIGTVSFESLFVATALFVCYALAVLAFFAGGEALLRRRVAWAWPDPARPQKHWHQMVVYAAFAVTMVAQVIWAEPHPSFLVVPFQAAGLVLVLSRTGDAARWGRRGFDGGTWRDEEVLGWAVFGLATMVLPAMHAPLFGWVVLLQLGVALVAAGVVYAWGRSEAARNADRRSQSGKELHLFHSGSLLLAMLVIGGLPGYQLLRTVFPGHLDLLVRHYQVELGRALEDRGQRPDGGDRARFGDLDLAFAPFLCTGNDIHDLSELPCAGPASPPADCVSLECLGWQQPPNALRGAFFDELDGRIPFITDAAVSMRRLSEPADVGTWQATPSWPRALLFERPGGRPPFQIVSLVPVELERFSGLWWLCAVLACALFALLAAWSSRRVFLSGISHASPVGLKDHLPPADQPIETALGGPRILFVCTRSTDRSSIRGDSRVHYVDLMAVPGADAHRLLTSPAGKIVCIDFFDHRFAESSWNEKLFRFVERLVYVDERRLFLLTSREATDLLGGDDRARVSKEAADRWTRLLGQFVTVHVVDRFEKPVRLPRDIPERCQRRLEDEYAEFKPLRKVAEQIAVRQDLERLSEDALIDQVREMSETHYQAVWTILPREERMVVAQLAAGAVVNPKSEEAIRHLLARGLLLRNPEVRLMNESFGRFVRETAPVEEIRAWEREGTASAWQQVRFPILLGLGSAVAFLVTTQQELFSVATAFISTAAVGTGTVIRLLTLLQQKTGSDPRNT